MGAASREAPARRRGGRSAGSSRRGTSISSREALSVKDDRGRLRVGAAIGAAGDYLERAEALAAAEVDVVLMDVAHAHSESVARPSPPSAAGSRVPLVVGNVATGEGARFLADLGAAAVKVGWGRAAAAGRGSRRARESRSSRRSARPGSRPRGRSRSSPTAASGTTRTLPRPRLRGLDGHARFAPLRHRRVARNRRRRPGDPAEGEALPRDDLSRGRRRRLDDGASPRPSRPPPRGSRSGCRTSGASSTSSPGSPDTSVGGQLRGRGVARGGAPEDRRRPGALPVPLSAASRTESFER